MKKITVYTTTYNRDYCLSKLYDSLLNQTSNDFMWLIVDDGSTDTTRSLVAGWINENKIEIQYVFKENGGMHTGHNKAHSLLKTELSVCIDSDDYMPLNAIQRILDLWEKYGNMNYAGIIGLDASIDNIIVGTKFPDFLKETTYGELEPRYGVICDKKIIYRTEIIQKYEPYPTFLNERFVPLYLPIVIDRDYKLLVFNEVFCIVDYQPDGSTATIFNQYFTSPKGFSHSRKIEMEYIPFLKMQFKSCIHYIATSIISKNFNFLFESPKKIMTFLLFPLGVVFYFYLLHNRNKKRNIIVKPVN